MGTASPSSSRGARMFCWLFIVIGAVAVGVGAWLVLRSLLCRNWPVTEGVIVSAEMSYHSSDEGGTYSADVSYDYSVAGVQYTSDRVAFGGMSASAAHAQAILSRYPVRHKVSVHYDPGHPDQAVLETGVHGGTWIALGVGTVFVLAGWMFLQAYSAIPAGQSTVTLQQPPILMGVIFMLMGVFPFFLEPSPGVPVWVVRAAGGFFVLCGLFLLAYRLENKVYSKILIWMVLLMFLAIFHWVSFAPGERIGTATTPFSHSSHVNVKWPFAAFTILIDVFVLAGLVRWLAKRRE